MRADHNLVIDVSIPLLMWFNFLTIWFNSSLLDLYRTWALYLGFWWRPCIYDSIIFCFLAISNKLRLVLSVRFFCLHLVNQRNDKFSGLLDIAFNIVRVFVCLDLFKRESIYLSLHLRQFHLVLLDTWCLTTYCTGGLLILKRLKIGSLRVV